MSVSAFGSVAPRDPRRPERGRTMERRHGFRVLCPSWRDGQQPPGRPRDQHARAAPDPELHGLHQHVDDSETTGAAALAREADPPRLRCADPADLGTRESVWPIRSRHEYAIGIAVIEMAPGDTTVGSTLIALRSLVLRIEGPSGPKRIERSREIYRAIGGEDTKRNLKHVGYLFSLVKARRKLLT